jgi:hypothetical protein
MIDKSKPKFSVKTPLLTQLCLPQIPREIKLGLVLYRAADKSLSRPGRKQATATEDFEFHVSYL